MKSQLKIFCQFLYLCQKVRRAVDSSFALALKLTLVHLLSIRDLPPRYIHYVVGDSGGIDIPFRTMEVRLAIHEADLLVLLCRTDVTHQSSRRLAFLAEGSR